VIYSGLPCLSNLPPCLTRDFLVFQIVGLSATLGIGQTTDLKSAVKVVKLLCANLDAKDGIVSVKDNLEELKQFTPSPEESK